MYQLKYKVQNAEGEWHEREIKLNDYESYQAFLNQSEKLGNKVLMNSMCKRCVNLGDSCDGEFNWVYTGCVARAVA